MKRLTSIVMTVLTMATLAAGCGNPPASSTAAPASSTLASSAAAPASSAAPADAAKELVIGCTLQNLSEEFMTMLKGSMEIQLKEYDNVKLIVNDAEGKPDKQASQLDSFIAQKVDAVIISPVDADALAPSVKAVADAGIPIITCSADVTGDMGQV